LAGFASVASRTRVHCASHAKGVARHAVVALRRCVWVAPETGTLGLPQRGRPLDAHVVRVTRSPAAPVATVGRALRVRRARKSLRMPSPPFGATCRRGRKHAGLPHAAGRAARTRFARSSRRRRQRDGQVFLAPPARPEPLRRRRRAAALLAAAPAARRFAGRARLRGARGSRDRAPLIGGVAGFTGIGSRTRVLRAARAPGVAPHAAAAARRPVPAAPVTRRFAARARPHSTHATRARHDRATPARAP